MIAPLMFGAVEREIGEAHQADALFRILRAKRDADRGARKDLLPSQLKWRAQLLENAIGQAGAIARIANIRLQDGEFIAADACDIIAVAQRPRQAIGHGDDHQIADFMAIAVIRLFEMIEVDIEKRELRSLAAAPADLGIDQLVEQKSVRQTGKDIAPRGLFGLLGAFGKPHHLLMRTPDHEGREQQSEGQQQQIDALLRPEEREMNGKGIADFVPGQKGADRGNEDDHETEAIDHRPARDAERIGLLLVALQGTQACKVIQMHGAETLARYREQCFPSLRAPLDGSISGERLTALC